MIDYKKIKKLLDDKFNDALQKPLCNSKIDFWSEAVLSREQIISKSRAKDARFNRIMREIFSKILDENCKVLDAGCGDGIHLEWLARNFSELKLRLHGFDLSEVILKRAKERLKFYPYLTLTNNSIDSIIYKDNTFDVIICFSVLQYHTLDPIKALGEMERVLKDGGFLVIYKPRVRHLDPFIIPDVVIAAKQLVSSKKNNTNSENSEISVFAPKSGKEIEEFLNAYLQNSRLKIVLRKPVLSSFRWSFYRRIHPRLIPVLARVANFINYLPLSYYKDSEIILLQKQ